MSDPRNPRRQRPRLDAGARDRILAEIARVGSGVGAGVGAGAVPSEAGPPLEDEISALRQAFRNESRSKESAPAQVDARMMGEVDPAGEARPQRPVAAQVGTDQVGSAQAPVAAAPISQAPVAPPAARAPVDRVPAATAPPDRSPPAAMSKPEQERAAVNPLSEAPTASPPRAAARGASAAGPEMTPVPAPSAIAVGSDPAPGGHSGQRVLDDPMDDPRTDPSDLGSLPPVAALPVVPEQPQARSVPVAGIIENWARLRTVPVHAERLERNLIITAARSDPAHGAFDLLRTRMSQAMAERGWKRVGITSPTAGCGKSFTALNLAITLSRYTRSHTVLLDLDLRRPALADLAGVAAPGAVGDMLRGLARPEDHLRRFEDNALRIGPNLALGLNDRAESYAAELFDSPSTAAALSAIDRQFAPELMLFDLPPVFAQDDVIALRSQYDCLLMVIGAGVTTPRDIREATRRIGEDTPILGMILNKADGRPDESYSA